MRRGFKPLFFMDLNEYKEDLEKQRDGTPIHVKHGTFIVRRFGTKESNAVMSKIERDDYNPFEKRTKAEEDELRIEQLSRWLAIYGVSDWEGVNRDGKPLKFSKKEAYDIFTNPAYFMSLNAELIVAANDYQRYLIQVVDEDIEQVKK